MLNRDSPSRICFRSVGERMSSCLLRRSGLRATRKIVSYSLFIRSIIVMSRLAHSGARHLWNLYDFLGPAKQHWQLSVIEGFSGTKRLARH